MIGCFNISLFSYFDIHRIFDLLSFRLWDFVLWWFDLDFLIFDFNFDFILCISFLFIFLIHFFLKLLFSFLVNYITINSHFKILKFPIIVCLTLISFVTFLFNTSLIWCLHILDIFNSIQIVCFQDFTGFYEILSINSKHYKHTQNFSFYIYILFYYILHIVNTLTIVALRFFFSYSYDYNLHTDYTLNHKNVDIKCKNLISLWTLHNNYIKNTFISEYYFLHQLNINFLVTFLLNLIFYEFSIFYSVTRTYSTWLFIKTSKNLVHLSTRFTIILGKHQFSNISHIHLFTYIIFLLNYYGNFIKDFNYINFIISPYLQLYIYTYYTINFNLILTKWLKKQLNFLSSF